MAFINRISDINNKLDINIENQNVSNNKLNNIDDNIETIRELNVVSNNYLNQITSSIDILGNTLDTIHADLELTNVKLDTVLTDLDTIHTDLESSNIKLDTLHTDLDTTIHGDIIGTNIKLDTIHTDLDTTIHGDIITTNTKLDTLHTDLDGLTFDGSSNLNVNVASGSITISSVNIKDSAGNNLTSTSNALNSYITNGSTTVDKTLFGGTGTVTGLNIYQIPYKTKTFNMCGNATNVANVMWAGLGSTIDVAAISFGTNLPAKTFYFYHTTSPVTPLSCILNYIKKSDGTEATYTINTVVNAPTQNTYYNLAASPFNLTDIACINSFDPVGSTVSGTSYRLLTSGSDTTKSIASIHNTDLQYCGFFMCPANARAYVSYLSVVVSASGDYLKFIKWTKDGYRRVINTIYVFTGLNNVFTSATDNGNASLSGWIYPGETFAINATGTSTNRIATWNITVIYD
jgi:hypothetical protein